MKWLGMTFKWLPKEPKGSEFEAQELFEFSEYWDLKEMGAWFFQNYPTFRGMTGKLTFNSFEMETDDHDSPV